MELTFYGGVGEIGGNKIQVKSGSTSVFLDFGKNFAREGEYYEEPFLSPRKLEQLLHLGILPELRGAYKGDGAQREIDAVVLSHAHTDHYDHIRFLRDDIPILSNGTTKDLILAREYCSKSNEISRWTKGDGQECFKRFQEIGKNRYDLGQLNIWQQPVDHSIPGAMGTMIDDGETRLVYSGDIRFHGPRADFSEDFVKEANHMEPDILVIEGTNMQGAHLDGERDVFVRSNEIVKRTDGLVLVGYPVFDIDRMTTLADIARETDRKLAISVKQANALECMGTEGIPIGLRKDDLLVFTRDKGSKYIYSEAVMEVWGDRVVDAADVNEIQEELILTFNLFDMNESLEIDPMPGSSYILSSSEPFNEEMWISHDRLRNWLRHLGIPLYQVHASGHATPHDLREMVQEIEPKSVVPIHTECPRLFQRFLDGLGVDVILPIEGIGMEF